MNGNLIEFTAVVTFNCSQARAIVQSKGLNVLLYMTGRDKQLKAT